MSVEFNWTWGPMQVEKIGELNNVVTGVAWNCTAIDSDFPGLTGIESGVMTVPTPNPSDFVLLDQLTSEIVNAWVDQNLDKSIVESKCLSYLEGQKVPPVQFVSVPNGMNPEPPQPDVQNPQTPDPMNLPGGPRRPGGPGRFREQV